MDIKNTKFISLGKTLIDKDKFRPVENAKFMNKPLYGFWGSPITSENPLSSPWIEWCLDSGWGDSEYISNSVIFTLKPNAKIFTLDKYTSLSQIPSKYLTTDPLGTVTLDTPHSDLLIPEEFRLWIDYEALAKDHDGIYISDNDVYRFFHSLYGWDCASILLFNLDCIKSHEYRELPIYEEE